jgi:hypothetical protein
VVSALRPAIANSRLNEDFLSPCPFPKIGKEQQ